MIQADKYSAAYWEENSDYRSVRKPVAEIRRANDSMLKPVVVLTTLLFLIIAPEPDSQAIADITTNFFVAENHAVLLASNDRNEFFLEENYHPAQLP